jgi:hypothetical protein
VVRLAKYKTKHHPSGHFESGVHTQVVNGIVRKFAFDPDSFRFFSRRQVVLDECSSRKILQVQLPYRSAPHVGSACELWI